MGARQIFLKREDLNHTGAHKINNVIGRALLAKRMGQAAHHRRDRRRPAWRGHRHHLRARLRPRMRRLHGQPTDVKRQSPNVYRMKLLGAGGAGRIRQPRSRTP